MLHKKRAPAPNRRTTRTVQPASRSQVFSYHTNRSAREGSTARSSEEQSQQPLKRLPKFSWRKRLPVIGALLVILFLTVSVMQLSNKAKVETAGTSEGQVFLRDKSVYQEAAQKEFSSFFNGNKLTVDASGIAANLKKEFPELREVSVALPIVGNQPVVYIQPAIPTMILSTAGGMFVLDTNGRAVITDNQVANAGELKTPIVVDQSGLPLEVGKIALPRTTVAFITEVVGQLQAKGIKITSLTLPAGTSELHVRLDGVGYYVKFNLHGAAREEAGAFIAVKNRLGSEQKTPKEYIDVRVENRAYYK